MVESAFACRSRLFTKRCTCPSPLIFALRMSGSVVQYVLTACALTFLAYTFGTCTLDVRDGRVPRQLRGRNAVASYGTSVREMK